MNKKIIFLILSCTIISSARCSLNELEQRDYILHLESSIKSNVLKSQEKINSHYRLDAAYKGAGLVTGINLGCIVSGVCQIAVDRFKKREMNDQYVLKQGASFALHTSFLIINLAALHVLKKLRTKNLAEIASAGESIKKDAHILQQLAGQQPSDE